MSEIICPYCGSSNPIDAVTCSTCKLSLYDDAEPAPSTPQPVSLDWLNQLREPEKPATPPVENSRVQPPPPAEPEIPDWLARIRARKSEDTQPAEPEGNKPGDNPPSYPADDNLPDWIKEIKQGDVTPAAREDSPQATIPEWLQSMADVDDLPLGRSTPAESLNEPVNSDSGEFSGLLEDLVPNEEAAPSDPENENPDTLPPAAAETESANLYWLDQRFSTQIPEPGEYTPATGDLESSSADQIYPPAEQAPAEPLPQIPDWIQESDTRISPPESPSGEADFADLRNDLANLGPTSEGSGLPDEGLPDWLFDQPVEPVQPGMDYPAGDAPNLETGQLPGWLNAMRPVEAAAPELPLQVEDNRVESNGPLAGYQGILPGQGAVTHYSHPPVYSNQIQVTDKQRIYATLFDTLIADEHKVGAQVAARSTTLQLVLRLVLGLILLAVLMAALVIQPGLAAYPTLVSPESVAFYDTLQSLTSTANSPRILVGLDYEASLSGELRPISTTVLQSWMNSKAGLVFISINQSGPALAEALVNNASSQVPGYIAAERVINLGYLPGGASALSLLAADPKLAAPTTFDGLPAWDSLMLQGMDKISDFDAFLLLTDNPESARAWIEQVKTASDSTPLLVVSSAQAAPVLQPYVLSGQITGMISGLQGGAAFEQLAQNHFGPVRNYWDAYQAGMLFSAALILLGAAFFAIRSAVKQAKKS